MTTWAILEQDLTSEPLFPVEPPDGRKDWPEIKRQRSLINELKIIAPHVFVFAVPNAGKRNPAKAKQEGIMGGVFDLVLCWDGRHVAWIEMKGYTAAGRPGALSRPQTDWGNRMTRLGHDVACCFTPAWAIDWLQMIGAPMNTQLQPRRK